MVAIDLTLIQKISSYELALPVDFLDVVVHLGGKTMAALQAPVLQDLAAPRSFHSGTEAVYPDSTTYFRLVCSLWHILSSY